MRPRLLLTDCWTSCVRTCAREEANVADPFKDDDDLLECVEDAFGYEDSIRYIRGYREQCERAAARQATLAVVERVRENSWEPERLAFLLDQIEREAKEVR